jgi:acetylornithine deacetylase
MSLDTATRLLRDYVAIPSVNPMGRDDLSSAVAGEQRYAEHVREALAHLGVDAELVGRGDRKSVVAEVRAPASAGAADTLLVASHLDTVPVDTMEIAPFDPVIEDGRLYGRGSCDTKGGLAALVAALEPVLRAGTLRRNLIVVGEADEEMGSVGVLDTLGWLRDTGRAPDWVIATEPTGLRIVTHHKGIAMARLEAQGVAGHSSDPGAGRNAIVSLARAVLALDHLGRELAGRTDAILGAATLSVGLVGGGMAPNIVPDAAWLMCDRRLLPGEDAASVRAEIEGALSRHGVEHVRIARCRVEKDALATDRDHPVVKRCLGRLADEGLPAQTAVAAFGTDAGPLSKEGWPAVAFGPGSIAQAHTAREYVEIDQVEAAARWFRRLLESSD